MKTQSQQKNYFHWIPRILCILAILFISMFALDVFEEDLGLGQLLLALLMHLLPSLILVAILILAWKRELLGGIFFILIGSSLSPFIYSHNFQMNHSVMISMSVVMMITFPFILIGILFLVSHYRMKKRLNEMCTGNGK